MGREKNWGHKSKRDIQAYKTNTSSNSFASTQKVSKLELKKAAKMQEEGGRQAIQCRLELMKHWAWRKKTMTETDEFPFDRFDDASKFLTTVRKANDGEEARPPSYRSTASTKRRRWQWGVLSLDMWHWYLNNKMESRYSGCMRHRFSLA